MSDTTPGLTPFDALIYDSNIQMMKAIIPYVHTPQQKFLSLFIKFNEMKNTMNLFENNSGKLSACSVQAQSNDPMDILKDIRNYCSDKAKESIDLVINFYSVMQMYSMFNESSKDNSGESGSPFDQLKMMLTPEQQEMFDTYSTMFNNEGGTP